jgi:glycosyltransferase involved in cell wall biosynthesis
MIAMSKSIVEFYVTDLGIAQSRISYIATGIDTEFYRRPEVLERQAAREALSLSENAIVCVLPGRLNFVKGHDIAVNALQIVRASQGGSEVVALFPGAGDQEQEIRKSTELSGCESSVQFLGYVTNEVMRQVMWASDIALLPSRFEGYGLAIAEAMSCGCVPIRTPSGGWQDQIVHGENGFIMPFNDSNALADYILQLCDPERRSAMQQKAIDFARMNFSQAKMIEQTSNLYRNMAAH